MARTQTEVVGFIENLQKGLAKVRKELNCRRRGSTRP